MVVVVGQTEVAREVDLDAVTLANRYSRHDVQEFVEDLRGRLGSALGESLSHEVSARRGQGTGGPALRDCAKRANGKRDSEDSEVVVVYSVSETCIADLVEALELVKVDRVSVRHDESMKRYRQASLTERLDWFCLT